MLLFFDNGFASNIIEPNKRDIKFIWDGFIMFIDNDITLEDIRNGMNLYDSRIVALQRTNLVGIKMNTLEVRQYIIAKLQEKNIPFEIINDTKEVSGYPSQCDLWCTRDLSVLLDAIDCIGTGEAYYFQNPNFKYEISFNQSELPTLVYSHLGAMVLRGENSTAISRLILNNQKLQEYLENVVGDKVLYCYLEGKYLPGVSTEDLKEHIKNSISK